VLGSWRQKREEGKEGEREGKEGEREMRVRRIDKKTWREESCQR